MTDNGRKPPAPLHNYRCLNCGRLQFRAFLTEGCKIHTRCPKCGRGMWIKSNMVSMENAMSAVPAN